MIKGTVDTIGNTRVLHCHTRTAAGAWALVRAVARHLAFTTVTPTMITDGACPTYTTPLVLFAAPYQFELCQVRADGYVGLCFLLITITEPIHHDNAPLAPRELQQRAVGDEPTALPLGSVSLRGHGARHQPSGWAGSLPQVRSNTQEQDSTAVAACDTQKRVS